MGRPRGSAQDRLGNVDQIRALQAAGYTGPISFEAFAPQTHALANPVAAIAASFDYIGAQLAAKAA